MTELSSSFSPVYPLKFLLEQKSNDKCGIKNDIMAPLKKFFGNVEFVAVVGFIVSRIHMASELLGLSVPFSFMFTDSKSYNRKKNVFAISESSTPSKSKECSEEKNLSLAFPETKSSLIFSVNIEQIPSLINLFATNQASKFDLVKLQPSDIVEKSRSVATKCNCPPMFGWIIPSNFFGNPFHINFACNENLVHISSSKEFNHDECVSEVLRSKSAEINTQSDITDNSNLQIYSSQLLSIVKDVCEIVKEVENRNESDEAIEVDCCDFSPWSTLFHEPVKEEIIEGGDHPLLDEGIFMLDETNSDDLNEIELLSIDFSGKTDGTTYTSPEKKVQRSTCDPPCSIWCDSARETGTKTEKFLKAHEQRNLKRNYFGMKSSSSEDLCKQVLTGKPLYKRSFSANDCLNSNIDDSSSSSSQFRGFDPVSRGKLILLRTDPVTYFKVFGRNKQTSWENCDKTGLPSFSFLPSNEAFLDYAQDDEKSSTNCRDRKRGSSMWGPFDGEDSLWQPLPDCIPLNEQIPKYTVHKRVRDLRRQKSVN